MAPATHPIHPEAVAGLRAEIAAADGNEVFFVGRPGRGFVVAETQVLARGHRHAVPGLLRGARPGEVVIHNHPSGNLTPSEPDLELAARWGAMGVAFLIIDNTAERCYTVVEPHQAPSLERLDDGEIEAAFGPSGRLASELEGYEHRPQQVAMARAVAAAFNDERVALIEAGTGTGKSLAYLLPAIQFAIRNRERVVVSTNTINLQEQLIGKDLPFLRDRLGLEFKAVLLKGRSNYLCLRKANFAKSDQGELLPDRHRTGLDSILEWATKTKDGSLSDLPFSVPSELWSEVASDGDDCMRTKSPHFGECFFFNSRREAAAADIIVVNHHLLMADLATRAATNDYTTTAVLPPYERIILDEAHNLEDVAASYFGGAVTALSLLKTLGRLQPERDERRGVLPLLGLRFANDPRLGSLIKAAFEARRELGDAVRVHFEQIAQATLGYAGVAEPGSEDVRVRLTERVLSHPAMSDGVVEVCRQLTTELGEFVAQLERILRLAGDGSASDPELSSALLRVRSVVNRLESAAELLAATEKLSAGDCRWIEVRRLRGGDVAARIAAAPLEVDELLKTQVFDRMKTVILTSATMTVAGSFDPVGRRLGVTRLARQRIQSAQFDSPFDYPRQALVLAPTDLPEPREPSFASHVKEAVGAAVRLSRGRAFVLFTSYGLMQRSLRALQRELTEQGFGVLSQGQAPRDQLLRRFRREQGSVLFAVDSFWEGVDVPGDALSLVILVRLPFKVPTEPLQEARVEAIQAAGRDPFQELTIPQAVIKFRQGFGRLIRTRKDRGAVLILDSRVVRKGYGRLFLDSLPKPKMVRSPLAASLAELERFFAERPLTLAPTAGSRSVD